ncbi:thioredoxin M-type, chloroplastic-like [Diospyros lotus]|uniref:thioredoxin M-type, chloroplastic-like n=1 Tax=Diospyros lotus TaxID=55363 RepID=UPI00225BFC26|nr:thioredoxin M-type, chloroplastic-like [Diospyros lotus]
MSLEFSSVLFTTTSGGGASVADFKRLHLPTCTAARPSSPSVRVSVSFSSSTASFGRSFSRRSNSSSSCVVCKASKAVDQVKEVKEAGWQSLVIGSETPVLVEFWAPWCGPCRMIAPVVDELAKEYAGKIRCYKLNTDESPNVAKEYGIRSIPTVLFFKDGERKENIIGAVPKSTLAAMIEKYLEA